MEGGMLKFNYMNAQDYYKQEGFQQLPNNERTSPIFTYYDMIDFAEGYHAEKKDSIDQNQKFGCILLFLAFVVVIFSISLKFLLEFFAN
jgi:hypothetical protein